MSDCKPCQINNNPLYSSGNCTDATTAPPSQGGGKSCTDRVGAGICPSVSLCSPWDLTAMSDVNCLAESAIEEQLNIAGAQINIHKLLGIHEQGLLDDLTNNGFAISAGDLPGNPAINAFDQFITEWRSAHTGTDVVAKAYIGYDFGPLRLENGRDRYTDTTFVHKDVSTLRIKQGCDSKNRATKIRVERSPDGEKWFGVAILDLQDCDGLLTYSFRKTVPSRWWRIRPLQFNGGQSDYWSIQALQFADYEITSEQNIQDRIFLENRDRDYSESPIRLKAQYSPFDKSLASGKFGFEFFTEDYELKFSFRQVVRALGRPFIIGDILELPSEAQFNTKLTPIKKYLEVTDVGWDSQSFTAAWVPTMQRVVAKPVVASQETQDIMGKLTKTVDASGLFDIDDGNPGKKYQDYHDISQTIKADALTQVPQKGIDVGDLAVISPELKQFSDDKPDMNLEKLSRYHSIYTQDALPPNGLPYTQGDTFPSNPKDGDFHRLTYQNISSNIPARLHVYSSEKSRWIFLQSDVKKSINSVKPRLQDFLNPTKRKRVDIDSIKKEI